MTISRWRSCASQLLAPLLVTSRHSSPSGATNDRPVAGTENELIQGSALPSLKSALAIRLCPESAGTCIPGDPSVAGALQSAGSAPGGDGGAVTGGGASWWPQASVTAAGAASRKDLKRRVRPR